MDLKSIEYWQQYSSAMDPVAPVVIMLGFLTALFAPAGSIETVASSSLDKIGNILVFLFVKLTERLLKDVQMLIYAIGVVCGFTKA